MSGYGGFGGFYSYGSYAGSYGAGYDPVSSGTITSGVMAGKYTGVYSGTYDGGIVKTTEDVWTPSVTPNTVAPSPVEQNSSGQDTLEEIQVNASRESGHLIIISEDPHSLGAGTSYGAGAGASSTQVAHSLMLPANSTPHLTHLPKGVNLAQLNGEAKYMGKVLADLTKVSGKEYAVAFYLLNGSLYYTDPVAGKADQVSADMTQAIFEVPSGATLVATEHSHPDSIGSDQTEPSTPYDNALNSATKNDTAAILQIEKHAGSTVSVNEGGVTHGGISIDPNLITYIDGTNGKNNTFGVYAYDNSTMLNAAPHGTASGTPGDHL